MRLSVKRAAEMQTGVMPAVLRRAALIRAILFCDPFSFRHSRQLNHSEIHDMGLIISTIHESATAWDLLLKFGSNALPAKMISAKSRMAIGYPRNFFGGASAHVAEEHLHLLGAVGVLVQDDLHCPAKLLDARIGFEQSGAAGGALDAIEVGGQQEAAGTHLKELMIEVFSLLLGIDERIVACFRGGCTVPSIFRVKVVRT